MKTTLRNLLILVSLSIFLFSCEQEQDFTQEEQTASKELTVKRKAVPEKNHARDIIETGSRRFKGNALKTTGSGSHLGIWLWYLQGTGYTSHAALASDLAAMGVKRIYVKVADGSYDPDTWPEVNDASVPAAYKNAGLEVWAWSYNYPGNEYAQADALYYAAKAGYEGYVTDIEVEFNNKTTELRTILQNFVDARQDAINYGHATSDFKIYCTSWGNPKDQGMNVDIIDEYVDGHMPQTYLEVWGSSYMQNAAYWVNSGTEEYQNYFGCQKPIHHIVSAEHSLITASQMNDFIEAAGNEASVWRVPGGGTSLDIWNDLEAIDWAMYDGVQNVTVTLNAPTNFIQYQNTDVSGTATGAYKIKAYLDQYEIADQVLSNGNYSFDIAFNTLGNNRVLKVVAYDNNNNQLGQSQKQINVVANTVTEEVTISAPASGEVGTPVEFSGTATSGITHVIVSVDSYQIANVQVTNGTYQFSYTFNSSGVNRQVVANGFDDNGNSKDQAETTITITEDAAYIPNFPYFYQYYNSNNPGGSCQNTSMAMILKYYGVSNITPDNISNYYGTSAAQTVTGWNSQFNSEAAYWGINKRASSTATGSVTQLRNELQAGRPVVVHGYFTGYGHVIVLTGFDGTYYYANDPAGEWCQVYGDGSCYGYSSTAGINIKYHKNALEGAVAPDGNVWMHSFYTVN